MHGSIGGCWQGDAHGEPEHAPDWETGGTEPGPTYRLTAEPAAYLTKVVQGMDGSKYFRVWTGQSLSAGMATVKLRGTVTTPVAVRACVPRVDSVQVDDQLVRRNGIPGSGGLADGRCGLVRKRTSRRRPPLGWARAVRVAWCARVTPSTMARPSPRPSW